MVQDYRNKPFNNFKKTKTWDGRRASAGVRMILRPYQEQALAELREKIRTGEPGLLVSPTGSGKSEIAGFMIRTAQQRGKRVGAVVNRRILVRDLCKRIGRLGLEYGVIMGSEPRKAWLNVHVASFDTLVRKKDLPPWDLVIVDECHFSLAPTYVKVVERLRDAGCVVVGLTATPVRGVNEGLGKIYKWMVRCPDTPDLISAGYLVQPRVFAPPGSPDLSKVEKVAGEYNTKQLAQACDTAKLTGDILGHWLKNGRGRPTIGFGVDIAHCQHMAEMFCAAGIRAVTVDHTYKGDFDLVWRKLSNYETEVVFNVGITGIGWDCPPVSCMIEARPTMSPGLFIQHCGRVLRISPGKTDAIINDHAGNSLRHGLPDEYRDWQLNGEAIVKPPADKAQSLTACKTPVTIDGKLHLPCYATFKTGPSHCPYCGLILLRQARKIHEEEGELKEVNRDALWDEPLTGKPPAGFAGKGHRAAWEDLKRMTVERGWKPKAAMVHFKRRFGGWPPRAWCAELKEMEETTEAVAQ